MKNLNNIIPILSILLITSCATLKENKNNRKCARLGCVKNTFVLDCTIVVNVTDTAHITKEGPTVYLENPCAELCDSVGNLKKFKKTTKKNGIKSTIKSIGNSLVVECDTDSLEAVITTLQTTKIRSERQTIEVPRKKTWFEKLQSIWFYISITAIIVYLALKIKRVFL